MTKRNEARLERDWRTFASGCTLSAEQVNRLRTSASTIERNVEQRLQVLGYFSSNGPERISKYFADCLWLIQNQPGREIMFNLYTIGGAKYWSPRMWEAAMDGYRTQIKVRPRSARIFCNAAYLARSNGDVLTAIRLYKKSIATNSNFALPTRKLALLYRSLAMGSRSKTSRRYAKLAVETAELSLRLRDVRGERLELLRLVSQLALDFGFLDKAEQFLKRTKKYGSAFYLWYQPAVLMLARLALLRKDIPSFNLELTRLAKCYRENRYENVVLCSASASLLNLLWEEKQVQLCQKLVRVLDGGLGKKDALARKKLKSWLKELERNGIIET